MSHHPRLKHKWKRGRERERGCSSRRREAKQDKIRQAGWRTDENFNTIKAWREERKREDKMC
jgi:hypothetical protein